MNFSNDGLVAFHYRSYGTFFYTKKGSIISIGDLPTTNIIEPNKIGILQSRIWGIFYLTGSFYFVNMINKEKRDYG